MDGTPRRATRAEEGALTRGRLLDVAEELFAVHGPEGVSIRALNTAAGAAQTSVHYHFGSKEELLLAVVRRRGAAVISGIHRRVGDLEAARGRPSARGIMDALAVPLLAVLDDDPAGGLRWLKLTARLNVARDPAVIQGTAGPGTVEERFDGLLRRAFPDADPRALGRAWRIAATVLFRSLGDLDTAAAHLPDDDPATISADFVEAVITFCADGLAAAGRRRS
jgi:AcrR family transcriptional regulator